MIYIDIKKANKLSGLNNLFVYSSKEDSFFNRVLEQIEPFHFYKKEKIFEVPLTKLSYILEVFKSYEISIMKNYIKRNEIKIPEDYKYILEPFDYQKDGIEYGLKMDSYIQGDEQGLGKTKQVLESANILLDKKEIEQCVILVGVDSLKLNWEDEVEKHLGKSCFVLGSRWNKKQVRYMGSVKDRIEDLKTRTEPFLITNIHTLLNKDFVYELQKKKDTIMLAVDEAHKVSNTNSSRGNNLQKLSGVKRKVAITGTPLRNNPVELYGILKWLGYENSDLNTFVEFYCMYNDKGEFVRYKNLHILQAILDKCMIRRTKDQVLNLPPKLYQDIYLEMSPKQESIYNEVRDWILQNVDLISKRRMPLASLIRLRQATGYTGILSSTIQESVKLDKMEELVENIVAEGRKVIVVSNWRRITDEVEKRLSKKYNIIAINGSHSDIEKHENKNKFQNDANIKVLVGTTGAMGVGLTLTAASAMIFLDSPWNREDKMQAEDRIHRIGTVGTVNIYTLIVKGTIDEKIEEIVYHKGVVFDKIVNKKNTKDVRDLILNLLS